MAELKPIQRTSLKTSLLDRYNASKNLANVGGGSATDVGTTRAETDFIRPNTYSNQFQVNHPAGFTSAAENYSTDVLKLDTTNYKG